MVRKRVKPIERQGLLQGQQDCLERKRCTEPPPSGKMGARFGGRKRCLRKVPKNSAPKPGAGAARGGYGYREAPGFDHPFDALCASTSLQPTAPPLTNELAPFRFASAMAWSGSCSSKICTITELSVKSSLIFGKSGPLELCRVHVGVRVPELVGVHAAAAEDGVLGELHHLLGDHAPRRLELPPLAVLHAP